MKEVSDCCRVDYTIEEILPNDDQDLEDVEIESWLCCTKCGECCDLIEI